MSKKKLKSSSIKKYKSAYIFFTQEKTPKYKKLFPNLLLKEIFKLIGKDWKKLTQKEKIKYYELEKKSKEAFNNEKEEAKYFYKKKKIEIKKPVRNRTAFMIYLHENKNKIDKKNCIMSLKNIGKLWKKLSEDEKQEYVKKSHACTLAYRYKKMIYEKKIRKMLPKKPITALGI